MKTILTIALACALAACAAAPEDDHCILPVTRNAGMGVRVNGCVAWQFGPSREQRERFNAAHGIVEPKLGAAQR